MELSVEQLAKLIGGTLVGEGRAVVRSAAGLSEATESDVSFLRDAKNAEAVKQLGLSKAAVILVPTGFQQNGRTLIEISNPLAGFAKVLELLAAERQAATQGVHPLSFISSTAKLGAGVAVGPFAVIDDEAVIGDGAVILAQAYIGRRSHVGQGTVIHPGVVIREDIRIGRRCILHANTVIGSDGYGFFFAEGHHHKIPQVGNVVIEDDVEIGASTAIDRAMTGSTIIRRGTKIDNLVHIAHNVEVGEHSLLMAQVGIAGSAKLGKGVVLAGQVGIADHANVGDGVQAGGQTGVKGTIDPGVVLFGSPAQPIGDTIRQALLVRRLPELFKDVKKLKEEKKVS